MSSRSSPDSTPRRRSSTPPALGTTHWESGPTSLVEPPENLQWFSQDFIPKSPTAVTATTATAARGRVVRRKHTKRRRRRGVQEVEPAAELIARVALAPEDMREVDDLAEQLRLQYESFANPQFDDECNPSPSLMKLHAIIVTKDKRKGKEYLKAQAKSVETAHKYLKKVKDYMQKYSMPQSMFDIFFESYRNFCVVLNEQSELLVQQISQPSVDVRRVITAGIRNLNVMNQRLKSAFQEATKGVIEPRLQEEPWYKRINISSFIQWIWNYKFALYIIGALAYNIYTVISLPGIGGFMDIMLRLVGAFCLTFFADKVLMYPLIERLIITVLQVVMSMIDTFFLSVLSTIYKALPDFMKKMLSVMNYLMLKVTLILSGSYLQLIATYTCQMIMYMYAAGSLASEARNKAIIAITALYEGLRDGTYQAAGLIYEFIMVSGKKATQAFAAFVATIVNLSMVQTAKDGMAAIKNLIAQAASNIPGYTTIVNYIYGAPSTAVAAVTEVKEIDTQAIWEQGILAAQKALGGDLPPEVVREVIEHTNSTALVTGATADVALYEYATQLQQFKQLQTGISEISTQIAIKANETAFQFQQEINADIIQHLEEQGVGEIYTLLGKTSEQISESSRWEQIGSAAGAMLVSEGLRAEVSTKEQKVSTTKRVITIMTILISAMFLFYAMSEGYGSAFTGSLGFI